MDYIMVSNRWLTSVQDASVKWGPSKHRNIHGKADHALVCCSWKWRLQSTKVEMKRDFGALNQKAIISEFNDVINKKKVCKVHVK